MIIALDVATRVGWSAGPVGARPPLLQWGSRHFGDRRSNGEVVSLFRAWLSQRFYDFKPTLCCFESPFVPHAGGAMPMNVLVLRRLLAMVGTVEAICYELRVECREATTAEFTKFFTGRGRWGGRDAKKAAVIAACRYHGWDVGADTDAADSLSLWCYAEAILSPRAAEHRRREAADRDREQHGEGPLFPSPEPATTNGPGTKPRAARKPNPTRELSLWPETAQI